MKWDLTTVSNVNRMSSFPEEKVSLNISWPSLVGKENVPGFPDNLYRATLQDNEHFAIYYTYTLDEAKWLLELLYRARR